MPDDQLDLLVAYLRQHGDRFVVDALRKQMLSEGHDPALVEHAIQVYQAEKPAPPARPTWPLALGIAFLNLVAILVVGGVLAAFEQQLSENVAFFLLGLLGIALVLEPVVGVVMIVVGGRVRRLGMGLLLGWVLFVGASVLLLGGFCLFMITQYN